MSVTFQLPDEIEQQLRRDLENLDQVAKEAALVELYRQSRLTHHQLATALGLGRIETDDLLKQRNIANGAISTEELNNQLETLRRLASR